MVLNMRIFLRRRALSGCKLTLCAVLAAIIAACGGFSSGPRTSGLAGESSYAALDMTTAYTAPAEDALSEESSIETVVIVARRTPLQDGKYWLSSR